MVDLLKSSKSAHNWSLVPSAHAIFENGVDWPSAFLGAGILGGILFIYNQVKKGNDLEKRVETLEQNSPIPPPPHTHNH